jgi:hypothetical protein
MVEALKKDYRTAPISEQDRTMLDGCAGRGARRECSDEVKRLAIDLPALTETVRRLRLFIRRLHRDCASPKARCNSAFL